MTFEFLEAFLRAIIVGVSASITVGPVAILCIQRTLSKNRRSGIISGLGVASADTFMAMIAYFFYSMLQSQIESYSFIMRVVGGVFVIGVGSYIFFQNPKTQIRKNRAGHSSAWQDFVSIFGITIANFIMIIPYILAFFAMFKISSFESFTPQNLTTAAMVMSGFFSGAALWWIGLACLINLFRKRFRPRHLSTINHVAGAVIAVLGFYTILSTFFNIIPNEFI